MTYIPKTQRYIYRPTNPEISFGAIRRQLTIFFLAVDYGLL
jgi:hypothetical protein